MLLLLATALAGWLPPETLEEDRVQQAAGKRVLLQAEGPIEAWEGPLRLTLASGPEGSVVLPPPRTGREVRIVAEGEVIVWTEANSLDAPTWDRWERELALWSSDPRGPMPAPPADLGGMALEWEARRELLDPDLWLGLALLETEGVRPRSQSDHPEQILGGEPWIVEGPGVLVVDHRAVLEQPVQTYQAALMLDREPTWEQWVTSEDPEQPGLGWARRSEVVVPPGEHEVRVAFEGAAVTLEASWRPLRPSLRSARALRSLEAVHTGVDAMEQAHALGGEVLPLARELVGTEADLLARARLIEHAPSADEALRFFKPEPLLVWALAQRWRKHQDLSPYLFVELAELLPSDPELLAELAGALRRPEIRPRDEAIRTLSGHDDRGRVGARWSGLPSTCEPALLPVGPGVAYTRLSPGQSARITLLEGAGYPILRMRGQARYLIDGREHRGAGDLSVALMPGQHVVEVLEGELLLPEEAAGEETVYERQLCVGDSQWPLPEPGAPVRVALTVVGVGTHVVATDDGQTWRIETTEPVSPVELWVGPQATQLQVRGEGRYGASMRRRLEHEQQPLLVLDEDPLVVLAVASRALVTLEAARGPQVAGLRLQRAAAYRELGLTGSARREADLVARMSEANPDQRERARALFPRPTHAPEPGPVTAEAALAEAGRLPPEGGALAWEEAAAGLAHPQAVLVEASDRYLADGDLVSALRSARSSMDPAALRRVTTAGTWEPLVLMEQDSGVRTVVVDRQAPDASDGLYRQATELGLGYPWTPQSVLIVRQGQRDRLDFRGTDLALDLLCRDEDFRVQPEPCQVTLRVDGSETRLELADAHTEHIEQHLSRGAHRVEVVLEGPGALVVRATVDGDLFAPQLPVTTHVAPLHTTVAGPALVRLRVHSGTVTLEADGQRIEDITDGTVVAISQDSVVSVTGTRGAQVSLSRLRWEPPEVEPPTETWRWIAPPATGGSADATELWMAAFDQLARVDHDGSIDPLTEDVHIAFWMVGDELYCVAEDDQGNSVTASATATYFSEGTSGMSTLNTFGDFDEITVCEALSIPQ